MDRLPFFYYDILSRIVPGAATLAAMLFFPHWIPLPQIVRDRIHLLFSHADKGMSVVVPLVLVGATYLIGVLFEAIDHFPGWKEGIILKWDRKAFTEEWCKSDEKKRELEQFSAARKESLRFDIWETLVYRGGRDPGIGTIFSHCHRFQAEYKMFLHLSYAVILFIVLWLCSCAWRLSHLAFLQLIAAVVCLSLFPVLAYLRNRRRWLQAISFHALLQDSDRKDQEAAANLAKSKLPERSSA